MDCKVFLDAHTYSNNHRLVKEIVADATRRFFPMDKFCTNKSSGNNGSGDGQCVVLDLGCGTCENTKWFGDKVGASHIIGLDWNPDFLKYAAEQDASIGDHKAKLQLHQVNLNQLHWNKSLPTLDYDLLTSFLTLHWVKNLTNCLESMKCIMTPEKTLMFHVLGIRPGQNFQATMKTLVTTERWGPVIKAFMHATRWQDPSISDWRAGPDPAGAFRDILLTAGFSVDLCARMAFTYTTESEAECRGHLSWLVPFTVELPQADRSQFMDDFMAVYGRHTRQEAPGRYVWENEVLVVLAQRQRDDGSDSRALAAGGGQ